MIKKIYSYFFSILKESRMKIARSSQYHSLLLLATFLVLPINISAMSRKSLNEIEYYQLLEDPSSIYVYCDKDSSKMADVINEISKFDPDRNSPVWQLKKHIENGYSIGLQEAVLEALAYAEKLVSRVLSPDQIAEVNTVLNAVTDQVADELIVDAEAIIADDINKAAFTCCGEESFSKILKV